MRKVILISLSVFVAVVAGGYCISWFTQAAQIRRSIEQAIAKANEQQKYITYDAIETSGFPSDIYVSIVRPHFTGRIDPFLKAFAAKSHPGQADAAASIPEWDEDALLDGRIIVGINALSDHYSLRISGNWQRTSKIGGQTLAVTTQSTGDSMCTLQMAHSGGMFNSLWNYDLLARNNPKDFLKDLRMFDCGGGANTTSDATSHEKLTSIGPWRFYVANTPQDAQQEVRFYLKLTDFEVTPQGDAMLTFERHAFSPNVSYPVKYSLLGKQNIEIDFSYAGPSDWQANGKNPTLDIKLSKFDITTQVSTSSMTFFLSNEMKGANRVARLAFKSDSNFGEQYDAVLQDMVQGFIQQLYASKSPQFPGLQPYLQKYAPDEFYAIVAPAIPNFHSLGHMVQALDVSYEGAADLSTGDVTLSDLELSASPYGIKGSGTIKRTTAHPLPEGHMVLTCSNCARLVDDVAAYAERLQKTMMYFQTPEQAVAAFTPIDSRLIEGIKGFLKAAAEPAKDSDPDKTAFVYTIVSNGASGVTVSGKSLNEVIAMYNEYVGTILKENAAAKITPAPGPASPLPAPAPAAPLPAK